MYEFLDRLDHVPAGPGAVTRHRGAYREVLHRHRAYVADAVSAGLAGVRSVTPSLFEVMSDERVLRAAWDDLAAKGNKAPGPDGHRYGDYANSEVWDLCRCLRDAIRADTYRPGPERVRQIPKTSGKGTRPIVLLNIPDRVVQRAVKLTLEPALDPLFGPTNFGFRPRMSHFHALATARQQVLAERRSYWVVRDLRDAFPHVPVSRLLQVLGHYLPDDCLLRFLARILPATHSPGLRQGGPLSPLMLNLYLHHVLDRPWQRQARPPLIRVADDLLVPCRTPRDGEAATNLLQKLLTPAGFTLKEPTGAAVCDLKSGAAVEWLGFSISREGKAVAVRIANRAWASLRGHLTLAHEKPNAPRRAAQIVEQWLAQRGPCYRWEDVPRVCRRVARTARELAFDEIPGPEELAATWQNAHLRWCRLLATVVRAKPPTGRPSLV
jgi:hypothetical protein